MLALRTHPYHWSQPSTPQDDDEFFILACDGLWDVLSSDEAVKYVRERIRPHIPVSAIPMGAESMPGSEETGLGDSSDIMQAVKDLVTHAIEEKGSSDNVTAVVGRITSPSLLAATVMVQGLEGGGGGGGSKPPAVGLDRPAGLPTSKAADPAPAGGVADVISTGAAEQLIPGPIDTPDTPAKEGGEETVKSPGNPLNDDELMDFLDDDSNFA